MDGPSSGANLRILDVQTRDTYPLFALEQSRADIEAAFEAGAQGYIEKPFDPERLIKALHAALNPHS